MNKISEPPRGGDLTAFEARIQAAASRFEYPATPAIARRVRQRIDGVPVRRPVVIGGLARAALAILVALAALMAVPEVRAAVLAFFRVGTVTIFPATPTPTPGPTPVGQRPVTATPLPTLFEFPLTAFDLSDLQGETTLEDARTYVTFPVMLPAHPEDLGDPDRVYLQHFGGDVVIMVWMQKDNPERIRMSLHALGPGTNAFKVGGTVIREFEINGEYALWTDGPYMLIYQNGDTQMRRMIDGNVMIWTVGEVTYRLEAHVTFDEAITIAESLK